MCRTILKEAELLHDSTANDGSVDRIIRLSLILSLAEDADAEFKIMR